MSREPRRLTAQRRGILAVIAATNIAVHDILRRTVQWRGILAVACLVIATSHGCARGEDVYHQLTLCVPGENIFCRCDGGEPGTKECLSEGESFGTCGPCEPRENSGPGAQASGAGATTSGAGGMTNSSASGGVTTSGGASTSSTSSGAGGTMTPGATALLGACKNDGDCQSLKCRQGFCTKTCAKVAECPWPASECVPPASLPMPEGPLCMPSCNTAASCAPYGAPPSQCGYVKAIDSWGVTVCGTFGTAHALLPLGSDCLPFDHPACNLGYPGKERVCSAAGVCAAGCFSAQDCPKGKTCSTPGNVIGNCQ
ncbi:MAG: hypothetical protein EXR75_09530 [Myxococcales bacterium]|nr:hypothetical protein [Myxococcales bacterium]